MVKRFFLLAVLVGGALPALGADFAETTVVRHNGRVKPFDAAARQTLRLVTGSEAWEKQKASAVIAGAIAHPDTARALKIVRLDFWELKKFLGLPRDEHFFTLDQLSPRTGAVLTLVRDAKKKRDADEKPTKLEQKAEQLYTKMHALEELTAGRLIERVPGHDAGWDALRIRAELVYFRLRPFEWAAAAYFFAFLFLGPFKKAFSAGGWILLAAALAFHTAGLALRIFILSRPPVSNMYESMIFMNWALMIYALAFAFIRKSVPALSVGAFVSALIMVYANLLPIDSSLDVLVPVLRSNYWLTIHVMTIVSSYGAFGLAMGLGHRHLYLTVRGRWNAHEAAESGALMFRIIQFGVILIGTGTFLGGVWANESWGRFWGWDPKETWAFITFLGYLIVVHLRYARRIGDFALALSTIFGFQLVLMTWYGVNFVLGRGLHSYGAGSGGMQWVIYYLAFEALFIAWIFRQSKKT